MQQNLKRDIMLQTIIFNILYNPQDIWTETNYVVLFN